MIRVTRNDGSVQEYPTTSEEWLAVQPEAKLRALFAGDTEATVRFHERMLDIDRRVARWLGYPTA